LAGSLGVIFFLFIICYFLFPYVLARQYNNGNNNDTGLKGSATSMTSAGGALAEVLQGIVAPSASTTNSDTKNPVDLSSQNVVVTHVAPPAVIKSAYMTAWVAGSKSFSQREEDLINSTELNAVVIDIKDYTGRISYIPSDPYLIKVGSSDARFPDAKQFISELHQKGIYVIGRVATFQDPYFVKLHPELAVKTKNGIDVWKDRKGISWLDAGAKDVWDYNIAIAKDAYAQGFDEINFDYIRFPSDGNMTDISYPFSGKVAKATVIKNFFSYLHDQTAGTGMKISADLFGMTTTNKDDLGIGQVLENALPYFDYVDPMVYPSHYPPTFLGYKNPADYPYQIVSYSMGKAVERANMASTSPLKLRPWLQDFNLGAVYTAAMVDAQMKATYDVGLTSWLMWDPKNTYTKGAFLPK
jgi:hypothetical protein